MGHCTTEVSSKSLLVNHNTTRGHPPLKTERSLDLTQNYKYGQPGKDRIRYLLICEIGWVAIIAMELLYALVMQR